MSYFPSNDYAESWFASNASGQPASMSVSQEDPPQVVIYDYKGNTFTRPKNPIGFNLK